MTHLPLLGDLLPLPLPIGSESAPENWRVAVIAGDEN
jgi:hypothetical protein